jgi:hypothetical protein
VRRYIIAVLFVLTTASLLVPSALADGNQACPAPGPDFGQHVADMTLACPLMSGHMFGTMVNHMARGIPCPSPMPCPMPSQ